MKKKRRNPSEVRYIISRESSYQEIARPCTRVISSSDIQYTGGRPARDHSDTAFPAVIDDFEALVTVVEKKDSKTDGCRGLNLNALACLVAQALAWISRRLAVCTET
jgi:hypothetical protein